MGSKLRRVDALKFKQALKSGHEQVKDLLVAKQLIGEAKEAPGEELTLQMGISSAAVDRDNDTVSVDGWKLDNYRKNPVVLWAHMHDAAPIARSVAVWPESGKLMAKPKFMNRDMPVVGEFSFMTYRMLQEGFLNAASVGFIPLKWVENGERAGWSPMDFVEQELLEWSVVPVPSNPEALVGARSKGIDIAPLVEWSERILDGQTDAGLLVPREFVEQIRKQAQAGSPVSVQAPAATAAAEQPAQADAEAAGGVEHDVVVDPAEAAPAAPAPNPQEAAIEIDVVAAVKASDESFSRAVAGVDGLATKLADAVKSLTSIVKQGRVLSAANEDKLRQAKDLLSAVIAQVEVTPEEESATPSEERGASDLVAAIGALAKVEPQPAHVAAPIQPKETSALSADTLRHIAEDGFNQFLMKLTGRVPDEFPTRRS